MTKTESGRLGGLTTAKKYGRSYMAELARRGAIAFHKKYRLVPINRNDFAIVNRLTGKTINTIIGNR